MKLACSGQIFEKYSNTNFHETPFQLGPRCSMRKDGRTDVKLTVVFRNFANASDSGTRFVSNQMKGSYQQTVYETYLKTINKYAIFNSLTSPLLYGTPLHIKRNTGVPRNVVWETLLQMVHTETTGLYN